MAGHGVDPPFPAFLHQMKLETSYERPGVPVRPVREGMDCDSVAEYHGFISGEVHDKITDLAVDHPAVLSTPPAIPPRNGCPRFRTLLGRY